MIPRSPSFRPEGDIQYETLRAGALGIRNADARMNLELFDMNLLDHAMGILIKRMVKGEGIFSITLWLYAGKCS